LKSEDKETSRLLRNATQLASMSEVTQAVDRMAKEISKQLKSTYPIVTALMNGGVVPLGMILTKLDFLLETDYLHPTRYNGSTSGGEIKWVRKPPVSFAGRTVLLVDDVLDNGITLQKTKYECLKVGAKKIYTAVLVDKTVKDRKGLQKTDFYGLRLPNEYLFGCGMDYKRHHRNLPGIFTVPEILR